ncbi:MAG: hypothetical protein GX938_00350 [Spirochaetales bacterium]|nr:hypothetical protein [Spirochaetales bacterium]
MTDAYINAVLAHLDRRERKRAKEELDQIFRLSDDSASTILALGHPADCATRFFTQKRSLIRGEHRLRYRKSLGYSMGACTSILLLLFLIPPFFQPVRITASLLMLRALSALAFAVLLSLFSMTLTFFIRSSRSTPAKARRWDEQTMLATLSVDDCAIKASSARLDMAFSLLALAFLLFLLMRPLAIALHGRPVFTAMIRPFAGGGMLLSFASLILASVKLKRLRYSRTLILLDSAVEFSTVVYSALVLTRWQLYHPAFIQLTGEARLKIVVHAMAAIWIALTVLERANEVYTVFRSTAPGRA